MDRQVRYSGNPPGNPPAGSQVKSWKPATCQISKSWKPAGGFPGQKAGNPPPRITNGDTVFQIHKIVPKTRMFT